MLDLVLRRGQAFTPAGLAALHVGIQDGRIAWLGSQEPPPARDVCDVRGLHILPGAIDTQVHFREPGATHKEDLESGSRAAVLGGITAVLEMPNTEPPTTTADALADKLARARGRMWCDHAFFVGAVPTNLDQLGELERLPGCAGVKAFLGRSTGGLLVRRAELPRLLRSGNRRIAVHSEDEERLEARAELARAEAHPRAHPHWRDPETARLATANLLRSAREHGRRVHVLHVTTKEELPLLAAHRDLATVEVTPQHLTLAAPECYEELGTFAQMNPPIREPEHREALWQALQDGLVDVIGSDHAPHTPEEKERPYPSSPSGMPGVQTLVPLLLDAVHEGRLTLTRFVDLTSAGPARIYGIARKGRIALGYDADLTVVDLGMRREVTASWLASRCGWSPFLGRVLQGWPRLTIVRGAIVMREDEVLGNPRGEPLLFEETLPRVI